MGRSVFRLSVLPSEGWPPRVILIGCSDRRPVLTDLSTEQTMSTIRLTSRMTFPGGKREVF